MNQLKRILVFVIAVVYLFLSTGVALLETHCLCSDSKSISLNSPSEPCNESISEHSCCGEDQHKDVNTIQNNHDCGCEEPVVTYLKLTSHLGDGSHGQYQKGSNLSHVHRVESDLLKLMESSSATAVYPDYLPPENTLYGRYLITFLNQRKIALLA